MSLAPCQSVLTVGQGNTEDTSSDRITSFRASHVSSCRLSTASTFVLNLSKLALTSTGTNAVTLASHPLANLLCERLRPLGMQNCLPASPGTFAKTSQGVSGAPRMTSSGGIFCPVTDIVSCSAHRLQAETLRAVALTCALSSHNLHGICAPHNLIQDITSR